jgi:hypothetical protein
VVLLELLPGIEIGGLRESRHDDSDKPVYAPGLARGSQRRREATALKTRARRHT